MMRERLVELLNQVANDVLKFPTDNFIGSLAEYLIANGVIVLSEANVVAYKKENTITPECITQALELLKSHAVMPDFRREVAFAHLLAEEKLKGEKE